MREFWPDILLLLLVLLALAYIVPVMTGFNLVSLSVKDKLAGEISAFVYDSAVNVSENQDIFIEFQNTGSTNYTVKIEEFIYLYDVTMDQVAYYYDSSVMLYPGMRRSFSTKFIPMQMGYYYIKVRVTMGTKRTEAWGSFYAAYPGYTPIIPAENSPIFITPPPSEPVLDLKYQKNVSVLPGRTNLTKIIVKNIGNATIHEMRLYLSVPNALEVDLSPSDYSYLEPGETVVYLLDILAKNGIALGEYPIDFTVVSREAKQSGTIKVNVSNYQLPLDEEAKDSILNYELLIADMEREIVDAKSQGVNTTLAEEGLADAKSMLQQARDLYDAGDYGGVSGKLGELKEKIKDVAFKLAQAHFVVFVAPAFSPLWLLIPIVAIAILFVFMVERRSLYHEGKIVIYGTVWNVRIQKQEKEQEFLASYESKGKIKDLLFFKGPKGGYRKPSGWLHGL